MVSDVELVKDYIGSFTQNGKTKLLSMAITSLSFTFAEERRLHKLFVNALIELSQCGFTRYSH